MYYLTDAFLAQISFNYVSFSLRFKPRWCIDCIRKNWIYIADPMHLVLPATDGRINACQFC